MKLGYSSKSRYRDGSEPDKCLKPEDNSKSVDGFKPINCLKLGYNSKSRDRDGSEPDNCLKPEDVCRCL